MLDYQIRQRLDGYADDRLGLDELEAWLQAETWDAPPGETDPLAADAIRLIAEFANGDWTTAELKEQLRRLATGPTFGLVLGVGLHGNRLTDQPQGVTITEGDLVRIDGSLRRSRQTQRSGIGIGGK